MLVASYFIRSPRLENVSLIDLSEAEIHPQRELFQSLNALDKKLFTLFPDIFRSESFFVEVGANDGINQSNTYFLEKVYGAKGVLIEPALNRFTELVANRSPLNAYKCAALVGPDYTSDLVRLLYCDLMTVALGSGEGPESGYEYKHFMDGSVLLPEAMKTPILFGAQAMTMDAVLKEAKAPSVIDLLSIDVEGSEFELLRGIDFCSFQFCYILIETWNLPLIQSYLGKMNYVLTHQLSVTDYIFRPAHFDRLAQAGNYK